MPTLQDLSTSSSPIPTVDPSTLMSPPEDTTTVPAINPTAPPVRAATIATAPTPPVTFPQAGTLSQLSDKPVNPDDLLKKALANSPDPAEADAKLQTSKALGDYFNMHPAQVHANFDATTQAFWGDRAKGQTPSTIWQKAGNMLKAQDLQARLDDLNGQMYAGDSSQGLMAQREDIKKQQAALGPTMGWAPQQIVGIAYQLGYQGLHAAETVVAGAGAVVDFGLSALTLGLLNKSLGFDWGASYLRVAKNESSKVVGSLVGGMYGSLIDRGVDPTYARIAATGLGILQVGLMALPIGEAVSKPVGDALANGMIRPMLDGSVDRAIAQRSRRPQQERSERTSEWMRPRPRPQRHSQSRGFSP